MCRPKLQRKIIRLKNSNGIGCSCCRAKHSTGGEIQRLQFYQSLDGENFYERRGVDREQAVDRRGPSIPDGGSELRVECILDRFAWLQARSSGGAAHGEESFDV